MSSTKTWDLSIDPGPHQRPMDPYVIEFVTEALKPDPNRPRLKELSDLLANSVTLSLIGPFYGAAAGIAENEGNAAFESFEKMAAVIVDRPGFNDYLMVRWMVTKNPRLIHRILSRMRHPDDTIASSAVWMVRSVMEQNPLFAAQVNGYIDSLIDQNEPIEDILQFVGRSGRIQ